MQLSFISAQHSNQAVISLNIDLDSNYERLMNVVLPALRLNRDKSYNVAVDGKTYKKEDIVNAGNLKFMNLKENDLVIIMPQLELKLMEISDNEKINLIRSIPVGRTIHSQLRTSRDGVALYEHLKKSTAQQINNARRAFERTYPGLLAFFESHPNDKWAFLISYRNCIEQLEFEKKSKGVVAAQQTLEEERNKARLQENYLAAMQETPEAFVGTSMLYIKIKLNGVDGHAFVDTGAAVSLVSNDYVTRANLTDLVNPDSMRTFTGIGGQQESLGCIWQAEMGINDHSIPTTLHVVSDGAHEVLLGLDLLLRHRAVINLAERTITFNGEITTNFLTPREAEEIMMKEKGLTSEVVTDPSEERMQIDQQNIERAIQESLNDEKMDTENPK